MCICIYVYLHLHVHQQRVLITLFISTFILYVYTHVCFNMLYFDDEPYVFKALFMNNYLFNKLVWSFRLQRDILRFVDCMSIHRRPNFHYRRKLGKTHNTSLKYWNSLSLVYGQYRGTFWVFYWGILCFSAVSSVMEMQTPVVNLVVYLVNHLKVFPHTAFLVWNRYIMLK